MKKIATLIFLSILPILLFSQISEKYLTEEKLYFTDENFEMLFHYQNCLMHSGVDNSVFWDTKMGRQYLIEKKLDTRYTISALRYLSYTQDESMIGIFLKYLESDKSDYYRPAIAGLMAINTNETTKIIEDHLLKIEVEQIEKAFELIKALSLITSETSINVLDDFQRKISDENELLYNYLKNSKQAILSFNSNFRKSKKLIKNKLFSTDEEEFKWCIRKLRIEKNEKFLPMVKDYYESISSDQSERKWSLLTLRITLNDTEFNKADSVLVEGYEKIINERRDRTLKLFRREN